MIEEGLDSAVVNILDSGFLVFKCLRTVELLTQLSGEKGEKWQWHPFPPMNETHKGNPQIVYYDEKIYIVNCDTFSNMYKMEMSNVSAGDLWTPMNSFELFGDTSKMIHSIANVDSQLFISR